MTMPSCSTNAASTSATLIIGIQPPLVTTLCNRLCRTAQPGQQVITVLNNYVITLEEKYSTKNFLTKLAADLNTHTKHKDLSMMKDNRLIQRDREVQGYR